MSRNCERAPFWVSRLCRLFRSAVQLSLVIALTTGQLPAGASNVEYSSVDQVSTSYEVPVTNPSDHITWPSVVLVSSATLDTVNPGDRAIDAPRGEIYLSLQASSGPVQRSMQDPKWGSFFSDMTPLPASALTFATGSGRRYRATRIDPVDQPVSSDDGLLDATYYFSVPISTRRGTIVISRCHTVGSEYVGFTGNSPVMLNVGGPTRIPVSFPDQFSTTTPKSRETTSRSSSSPTAGVNWLATIMTGVLALFLLRRRHRSRRGFPSPPQPPVQRARPPMLGPSIPSQEPTATPPRPPAHPSPNAATTPRGASTRTLRVDLLGPLSFTPSLGSMSDPVRAIIAYLAMNGDRVLTLDEIQTAVWPLTSNGTDITRPSMRNYMTEARRAIGEEHLPSAARRPGYRLVDVDTDWAELQRLVARASQADKAEGLTLRRQALNLARGVPFTADTSRYFTWTLTPSIVYRIVETVTALAHGVSRDLVMAGDLEGARAALTQGMLIEPASLTLWEDLTDVLLEVADPSLMTHHWRSADLVLGPDDVTRLRARQTG